MSASLTFAFPKGRIAGPLATLLARPPLAIAPFAGRSLIVDVEEKGLRFLILKDFDVPTYVRRGAADLGVVGSDVLSETECDLPRPLEFPFGRCRFSLLAPAAAPPPPEGRALRVATKYVRLARDFFDRKGIAADIVTLSGSVELAPRMGLADFVADLVDTGETMRANGLEEVEKICDVAPQLVVNRGALARRRREVFAFVERLEGMLEVSPDSPGGGPCSPPSSLS
jgi:ATP phosphoribosyltransferase